MQEIPGIQKAIQEFVQSLFMARENSKSLEEFTGVQQIDKSYRNVLKKCVKRNNEDTLDVWNTIGEILFHQGVLIVWDEKPIDPAELKSSLQRTVLTQLHVLNMRQWYALSPIGRQYTSLPEIQDYAEFKILNPLCDNDDDSNWASSLFSLLCKVIPDQSKSFNSKKDSMEFVLEHQASKTGSFRNPLLLMKLKKGSENTNRYLAKQRIVEAHSLLNFTYLIYTNIPRASLLESATTSSMPSQFTHYELGGITLLDTLEPDNMDYNFDSSLIEEVNCRQISVSSFQDCWSQYASKYYQIKLYPNMSKIAKVIRRIMRLIGDSRFSRKEWLPLFCVIGMEAMLNLRDERDNLSERFALSGAALLSND